MKVSFITPTADRPHFLHGLYSLVQKQNYPDWEWLIYDTSLHPQTFDDPRVLYVHDDTIMSIGEKRNRLIQKTTGEVIIHFDDDDYYAPSYAPYIVKQLQGVDFFTMHSWFSYDMKAKQTYYWATDEITQTQFYINSLTGGRVREIDFGPNLEKKKALLNEKGRLGYGFSYAYRKPVALACPFEDRDFGEDRHFYHEVQRANFTIGMDEDREGKAVHVIHEMNTSGEYPQYRIPHFLAEQYLPQFFTHIARYHEDGFSHR